MPWRKINIIKYHLACQWLSDTDIQLYAMDFRTATQREMRHIYYSHNERDRVSNHQPRPCLLNSLFRRISNKTSKLLVTSLCGGNSPVTSEFPAQMASNAENISIWWRHYAFGGHCWCPLILLHPTHPKVGYPQVKSAVRRSPNEFFAVIWLKYRAPG